MTTPVSPYATAAAFRQALEARLKARAEGTGTELDRLRRLVAFDRLLARLFAQRPVPWVVKGGFVFEVRYHLEARVTKDLDLGIPTTVSQAGPVGACDVGQLHEALQRAAAHDAGDFFEFSVGTPNQPFTTPPEGGARFPVEARLAGRIFAEFHLDAGVGDILQEPPDEMTGAELLSFAGIAPTRFPALPVHQQFAEKLHAYTRPWNERTNTRVKDLVDLLILIEREPLDPQRLAHAVNATFQQRATHSVPFELPYPPADWEEPFARLAREAGLTILTLDDAVPRLAGFWDTVPANRQTKIGDQ